MTINRKTLANGNVSYESYKPVPVGSHIELPMAANGYSRERFTIISCVHDGIRMFVVEAQPDNAKAERARAVAHRLFRVLGTTDAVTVCDCCGKTGLKVTFAIEMTDTGERFHYGSTCVTRNTGRKTGELHRMQKQEQARRKSAAQYEYRGTGECKALEARMAEARKYDVTGSELLDFCAEARMNADLARKAIAEKHGVSATVLEN